MTKFEHLEDFPYLLQGRMNSFIATSFDDSMTVEMQMRVLIDWIKKNIALTNSQTDYLNTFIDTFDDKLHKTTSDVLDSWVESGLFNDLLNKGELAAIRNILAEKADKSFVDAQFANIISGTPKGTFDTLTALQTAYPNGTEGVFLVTENGHWYYYVNGWQDGGVYQATQLTTNQLDTIASRTYGLDNLIKNGKFYEEDISNIQSLFNANIKRVQLNGENVLQIRTPLNNTFSGANFVIPKTRLSAKMFNNSFLRLKVRLLGNIARVTLRWEIFMTDGSSYTGINNLIDVVPVQNTNTYEYNLFVPKLDFTQISNINVSVVDTNSTENWFYVGDISVKYLEPKTESDSELINLTNSVITVPNTVKLQSTQFNGGGLYLIGTNTLNTEFVSFKNALYPERTRSEVFTRRYNFRIVLNGTSSLRTNYRLRLVARDFSGNIIDTFYDQLIVLPKTTLPTIIENEFELKPYVSNMYWLELLITKADGGGYNIILNDFSVKEIGLPQATKQSNNFVRDQNMRSANTLSNQTLGTGVTQSKRVIDGYPYNVFSLDGSVSNQAFTILGSTDNLYLYSFHSFIELGLELKTNVDVNVSIMVRLFDKNGAVAISQPVIFTGILHATKTNKIEGAVLVPSLFGKTLDNIQITIYSLDQKAVDIAYTNAYIRQPEIKNKETFDNLIDNSMVQVLPDSTQNVYSIINNFGYGFGVTGGETSLNQPLIIKYPLFSQTLKDNLNYHYLLDMKLFQVNAPINSKYTFEIFGLFDNKEILLNRFEQNFDFIEQAINVKQHIHINQAFGSPTQLIIKIREVEGTGYNLRILDVHFTRQYKPKIGNLLFSYRENNVQPTDTTVSYMSRFAEGKEILTFRSNATNNYQGVSYLLDTCMLLTGSKLPVSVEVENLAKENIVTVLANFNYRDTTIPTRQVTLGQIKGVQRVVFNQDLLIANYNMLRNVQLIIFSNQTVNPSFDVYDVTVGDKATSSTSIVSDTIQSSRLETFNIVGSLPFTKEEGKLPVIIEHADGDNRTVREYATLEIQGDSSSGVGIAKKSYRVRYFTDDSRSKKKKVSMIGGVKPLSDYNFKAYWGDWSMSHDVVISGIMKDIVMLNTDNLPDKYYEEPEHGLITGVPQIIKHNGAFLGVYSVNTKKGDAWNSDKDDANCAVIQANMHSEQTAFRSSDIKFDGTDFEIESPDEINPSVKQSFVDLINFGLTATKEEFIAGIADKINLQSVANAVFSYTYFYLTDTYTKNTAYETLDGKKWQMIMYDHDIAFGVTFNQQDFIKNMDNWRLSTVKTKNNLIARLFNYNLIQPYLMDIYTKFESKYGMEYVIKKYEEHWKLIGMQNYHNDVIRYPTKPFEEYFTLQDLKENMLKRNKMLKKEFTQANMDSLKTI